MQPVSSKPVYTEVKLHIEKFYFIFGFSNSLLY